jgi:hypothetical protein
LALDSTTGNYYQKASGAWSLVGNLQGPSGVAAVDRTLSASDTVATSDNGHTLTYPASASANGALSLACPSSFVSGFVTATWDNSATYNEVVTPGSGCSVNYGTLAAQSSLTIAPGMSCTFNPSSTSSTAWNARCAPYAVSGGALPSCSASQLLYYPSSGATANCLTLGTNLSLSGNTLNIPAGVANTTFTNATTTIAADSCSASAVTVTMTGLATSSVLMITPSTDVSGSTGWGSSGGLVIDAWPSAANTMSYKICNQTAASITPAAVAWNVGAR